MSARRRGGTSRTRRAMWTRGDGARVFAAAACLVGAVACPSPPTDENAPVGPDGASTESRRVVWSDEFAQTSFDNTVWAAEHGTGAQYGLDGWGNQELQFYTARPENVAVVDGVLQLTARRESVGGASFTSARLTTRDRVEPRYGRIEASIRLPDGEHTWPAFWLLGSNVGEVGWPDCGEIDIVEYRGQDFWKIHGSAHGPGFAGADAVGASYVLPGRGRFSDAFHVFAVEWTPSELLFFVDDVAYHRVSRRALPDGARWVFDHPFHVIVNLAVGGTYSEAPQPTTRFPQQMLVDFVRVYEALP